MALWCCKSLGFGCLAGDRERVGRSFCDDDGRDHHFVGIRRPEPKSLEFSAFFHFLRTIQSVQIRSPRFDITIAKSSFRLPADIRQCSTPKYRHHRGTVQGVVTIDGKDFYLGKARHGGQ